MASFTEVGVQAVIRIIRNADGTVEIHVTGRSLDAENRVLRSRVDDITSLVSQGRRDGAADLMADVEARLKQLWNIP